MARLPAQNMVPGMPDKPANLSDRAALEWDRLTAELLESNIQVAKAHRSLIASAATIAADIADAWTNLETDGAYIPNEKSGGLMLHPAARRMDGLRRDYIKVLSLIGLRTPVAAGADKGQSLEDILNG